MSIETREDWAAMMPCCCPPHECPQPLEECKSSRIVVTDQGHRKLSDTEWIRYLKQGWTTTIIGTYETYFPSTNSDFAEFWGDVTYSDYRNQEEFEGYEWDGYFIAGPSGGGEGCPRIEPVYSSSCSASGISGSVSWSFCVWGPGFPDNSMSLEPGITTTRVISDAEGLPTDEFAAWRLIYPTDEDYDDAVDAYDAYLIAYDEWVLGGEMGTEPDPVPFPSERPTEFYPPCTYKITTTVVVHPAYFCYNSDGSSGDPNDPAAFAEWVANNGAGDPPSSGTAVFVEYTSSPLSAARPGESSTFEEYKDSITYDDWVVGARAIADEMTSFENPNCLNEDCEAFYEYTQDPEPADDPSMTTAAVRIQFQVPATWLDQNTGEVVSFTGTFFKIIFDVLEEPEGWDDTIDDPDYEPPVPNDPPEPIPQVPKPGRPVRSFLVRDVEREWTGPGTGPQDDPSWLLGAHYDIPVPTTPGVRRIVNRRYYCTPNSPYGFKPQVTGEGVDLTQPPLDFREAQHSMYQPLI